MSQDCTSGTSRSWFKDAKFNRYYIVSRTLAPSRAYLYLLREYTSFRFSWMYYGLSEQWFFFPPLCTVIVEKRKLNTTASCLIERNDTEYFREKKHGRSSCKFLHATWITRNFRLNLHFQTTFFERKWYLICLMMELELLNVCTEW